MTYNIALHLGGAWFQVSVRRIGQGADKLSDTALRQAKPRDRQYKLHDGGQMYLLVKPDGSKLWMMDYHHHGKRNK